MNPKRRQWGTSSLSEVRWEEAGLECGRKQKPTWYSNTEHLCCEQVSFHTKSPPSCPRVSPTHPSSPPRPPQCLTRMLPTSFSVTILWCDGLSFLPPTRTSLVNHHLHMCWVIIQMSSILNFLLVSCSSLNPLAGQRLPFNSVYLKAFALTSSLPRQASLLSSHFFKWNRHFSTLGSGLKIWTVSLFWTSRPNQNEDLTLNLDNYLWTAQNHKCILLHFFLLLEIQ